MMEKKDKYIDKYILDEEGNAVPERDLLKWAEWFETSGEKRKLSRTEFEDSHVSTVFLGLDHNFGGGTPILWETMVFENQLTEIELLGKKHMIHKSLDEYSERYHTKEEAVRGHASVVSQLQAVGHKLK